MFAFKWGGILPRGEVILSRDWNRFFSTYIAYQGFLSPDYYRILKGISASSAGIRFFHSLNTGFVVSIPREDRYIKRTPFGLVVEAGIPIGMKYLTINLGIGITGLDVRDLVHIFGVVLQGSL